VADDIARKDTVDAVQANLNTHSAEKAAAGTLGHVLVNGNGLSIDANGLLSADARIESGTWTPSIAGSTTAGNHTYSVRLGGYYKIGNLVIASFNVTLTAKDAAMAGNARITGLPYSSGNLPGVAGSGIIDQYGYIDLQVATKELLMVVYGNVNYVEFMETSDNSGTLNLSAGGITNNTVIKGTIIYRVA
jgi:hypothetical protein